MDKYDFDYIVVLDDDETSLYITRNMIIQCKNFARHIQEYTTGFALLQELEKHTKTPGQLPELLLLDVHMPFMNGFDFLERLLLLPETVTGKMKIAMLSNESKTRQIDDLIKRGIIIGFFSKPFQPKHANEIKLIINSSLNP